MNLLTVVLVAAADRLSDRAAASARTSPQSEPHVGARYLARDLRRVARAARLVRPRHPARAVRWSTCRGSRHPNIHFAIVGSTASASG